MKARRGFDAAYSTPTLLELGNIMKKLLLAAAAAIVVLTGCSVTVDSKPPESATQSESASPRDAYLQALYEADQAFTVVSEGELLAAGEGVCDVVDAMGPDAMGMLAQDSQLDPERVGMIAGAAVSHLCPEHLNEVSDWLANQ